MSHPYLEFSRSSNFPGKLAVGSTSSPFVYGNALTNKDIKVVEIPSSFNRTRIVEIAPQSLRSTNITSVFIPKSIISIGTEAFNACKYLVDVRFEKGSNLKTIGAWTFHCCESLKKIDFPSSVTTISIDSRYLFFAVVSLECFSYSGSHDFSSINSFFDNVPNVYVSNDYKQSKFAGIEIAGKGETCRVSREHLEAPNYGLIPKDCSFANHQKYSSFQYYMFILVMS